MEALELLSQGTEGITDSIKNKESEKQLQVKN